MLDVELLCAPFSHNRAVVVDWIGNRWTRDSTINLPDPETWSSPRVPRAGTGDGWRYGSAEWAAFGLAARLALETGEGAMLEAGASQAPWCLSWVRALSPYWERSERIRAFALEAADGEEATRSFWAAQGLDMTMSEDPAGLRICGEKWQVMWRRSAVVAGGGEVLFPKVDIRLDNGARPELEVAAKDYRGLPVEYEAVPGVDLSTLLEETGPVSLLHCDLQGAEKGLLEAGSFSALSDGCDVLVLGTHSRGVEDLAFDVMPKYGFRLVEEVPCGVEPEDRGIVLVNDGEQVWLSPRAWDFYQDLKTSDSVAAGAG